MSAHSAWDPDAMIRVILSTNPDAFILGRRRIGPDYRLDLDGGSRVPGYHREIVSTPPGRYGVILYTRAEGGEPRPEL